MEYRHTVYTLFVIYLVVWIKAHTFGGPMTVCNDPYPHHHGHFRELNEASPYSITLNQTSYNPGDVISITIGGTDVMRGYQIGAHATTNASWEVLYGEFISIPEDSLSYKYYSEFANCVTHTTGFGEKRQIKLLWRAPIDSVGDILFSSTVMRRFDKFWVNVTALLTAEKDPVPGSVEPPLQVSAASGFHADLDYRNCGSKSGCVTFPADCDENSCRFVLSHKKVDDGIRVRMTSQQAAKTSSYIALGISDDIWMTRDETFTCMDIGGSLDMAHGYNPGYYNVKIRTKNLIRDLAIQSVDRALICEFTRNLSGSFKFYGKTGPSMVSRDYSNGLDEPNYYLYLAWGIPYEGAKETVEKHIEMPIVSKSKVAFGVHEKLSFYQLHDTVKVHITFMVVAWFGASAIAIIIGRYFRDGFVNSTSKICGLKPWFQVHRSLAISAGLITAVAFVIIFVHYGRFTTHNASHARFGIAVMTLTVLQVLAGFLRPDVSAGSKRTVFNWVHRLGGMTTYTLSAVTIFLGNKITYMSDIMHTSGTGLLAGLVALQVLTAILLQIVDFYRGKSNLQDTDGEIDRLTEKYRGPKTFSHAARFSIFTVYSSATVLLLVCYLSIVWMYH